MSYRPQCSYWLYVSGEEADKQNVHQLLQKNNIIPDYLVQTLSDDPASTLAYSVAENVGTIEEWSSMTDDIGEIAKAVPGATIVMYENNEEDKSEARKITWRDGDIISEEYARVIAPGKYDGKTLDAVCAILNNNNMPLVEKLIRDELSDQIDDT